jgi:hypothetical protein
VFLQFTLHSPSMSHSFLCIHEIYLCIHAIGAPEGVTLLEFEEHLGGGAGATEGARRASRRRSSQRSATWVPWPPPFFLSKRQAQVHVDPTFVYIYIFEYFYLFIALSCRSWVKTLAALYLSLSRYRTWTPIKG